MIQSAEVKKKVEHANYVLNSLYGSPRRALAHRLICQGWNGEDHMLNIVSVSEHEDVTFLAISLNEELWY